MNDYEIREALCHYMDYIYIDKFRIIDELVIGKARADIVIVKDSLTGYEIKSDTDSYKRLPGQVNEYDKYFQKSYLVVGTVNIKTAANNVPPYWGIIYLSETENGIQNIETVRKAEPSPKFNLKKQLSLLWRKELNNILKTNGLSKCSGKNKAYIFNYLLECLPKNILQKLICRELLERDWTLQKLSRL
jgi:hypothetical protein